MVLKYDFKLSRHLNLTESSRATSRVSSGQKPNVSKTFSASVIRGIMSRTDAVVVREDFIEIFLKVYTF
jgi:hypothetical protein